MTDLKIEVGKCYRTRSGQRAMVLFVHPANPRHSFVGWIERDQDIYAWDGRGDVNSDMCGDPNDLISEWKEPRKGEVWVSVAKHDDSNEFSFFACEYRLPVQENEIAILGPIPWTEGEGLPDNGSGE